MFAGSIKQTYRALTGGFRLGKRHEERARRFLSPEAITRGETGEFDGRSLLAWCAVASRAGVPAVDAEPWVTLTEEQISALTEGRQVDTDKLGAIGARGTDSLRTGWIVRHDHMGSERLKIQAVVGEPPEDGLDPIGWVRIGNFAFPDIMDRRHYSAVIECGSAPDGDFPQVFVQRPWINTRRRSGIDPHREGPNIEGTWPREWRVFIMGGRIAGISNYYLQTPATGDAEDWREIEQVTRYAEHMLAAMCGLTPVCLSLETIQRASKTVREKMPMGTINGTLDFIVRDDGAVLFLEGGPPYTPPPYRWGGHPCCFLGREWPEGVALGLDEGVHPMWQGIGEKDAP